NYIDTNGCLSGDTLYPVFSDFELMLPNAFTPNGDGLNDVFGPDPNRLFYYELQVFDRFGKQQAQLIKSQWDGSDLPSGSYVYFFKYQLSSTSEERVLRGIVNLIR
ncbi:MAG: gliding motility-associated C-terminal domain-containing protein, partial [Croceimicrobium sp.]